MNRLGPGEVGGEVAAIRAAGVVDVTDANVRVGWVKHVGAMT